MTNNQSFYKDRIKKLLRSETARDSSFLFVGTIISNLFGFIVIALLTRNLDPSGFGLFITAMTFAQLVADFSELGINIASLNFISSSESQGKKRYVKNSFAIKVAVELFVLLVVFIFAEVLTEVFFHQSAMTPFVKISAFGIFFLAMITWAQNIFQAEKRFLFSSLMNSSTNIFRFLIIGCLVFLGVLTSVNAYLGFQLVLGLSLAIFFLKYGVSFLKEPVEFWRIKKLIIFGFPIGVSFAFAAIYTRLDQLLVFNYLGSEQAGIYGLAYRLIAVLVFFITSFSTAIAPRFASLAESDFGKYFKKSLLVSVGLIGVTILGIILSPFLIPLIFGDKFSNSITVYQILSLGIIFFILTIPLNLSIIFRSKKNHFVLILAIASLLISWVLLHNLVPALGIKGAAIATAAVNAFQLLAHMCYYWYLARRSNKNLL